MAPLVCIALTGEFPLRAWPACRALFSYPGRVMAMRATRSYIGPVCAARKPAAAPLHGWRETSSRAATFLPSVKQAQRRLSVAGVISRCFMTFLNVQIRGVTP